MLILKLPLISEVADAVPAFTTAPFTGWLLLSKTRPDTLAVTYTIGLFGLFGLSGALLFDFLQPIVMTRAISIAENTRERIDFIVEVID